MDHFPKSPVSGDVVTITAKATDPDGMGSVVLEYQVVDPGNYIRLGTTAYTNAWTPVAMVDNGLLGDAAAGDSVYTVRVPANIQTHRRLIRYRLTAGDRAGNFQSVPYADDPSPNFAFFVYDGVPAWSGAVNPAADPPAIFGTNIMRKVRPLQPRCCRSA